MTKRTLLSRALVLSAMVLAGCVMMPPPQSGGSPATSEPGTTAPSESGGMPSPESSETNGSSAPDAPVPTSIEVHSDCPQTLPLFIGDKPKFGSGTKTSIGSNTTTTFPRKSDGSATIWIIDEQENGVASVNVTPQSKRVEIGRDCKAISSR